MVRTGSDGQLGALLAACRHALADDPRAAPFATALSAIEPRAIGSRVAGEALPVLRWWGGSLAQPGRGALSEIACALEGLRPALSFTQNPNYVAAPPSPTFLGRYGYAVIAGPASGPPALVEHPDLAFGVLLLGPETSYPTHVHPAVELYLPLGPACWSVDAGPLVERPAGTPIVHGPNQPHETRSGEVPLAALYVWLGELETAARILGPGFTRP
jgi:hypothetical protein